MLTTLRIKNLGLVDDITLELGPGFTTMTGETGAGKSMIIGALNLILGQRADRKLIRSGTDLCVVEAVFDLGKIRAPIASFLEENGLEACEQNQLMIKRTVASSGNNRQFINHSPASLNLLTTLGRWLVDIHGPYDHQSLFDQQTQLEVLDAFAGATKKRQDYGAAIAQIKALQREKEALITDEQSYAQQLDLLRFQTHEIASARLDQVDEESLEDEFQKAQNAAQIRELCQILLGAIGEAEPNMIEIVAQVGQALHQLSQLDPQTEQLLDSQIQIADLAEDLRTQLSRYVDTVDIEPSRLIQLEEQINGLQSLKRKYGSSVREILEFGNQADQKLRLLESRDVEVERINADIQHLFTDLTEKANQLSKIRRTKGVALGKATVAQLEDLGFEEGRFEVQLTDRPNTRDKIESLRHSGEDQIEFLFGPNPGEPLHPLKKIASSGEIARVMLALKTVLATEDDVPLLVFDEVDANVGGETAHAVGERMRLLGQSHQVLCITHLAPVAAAANEHYRVSKKSEKGRTQTSLENLNQSKRIEELGRMLGGKVSAAKKHAEALLKALSKPKKK
ncbi:DNA repair protein RecN [bacterium]|jgi:DNA repair protein RecN (Recombination protein N)|nr:DNA repair protein RecN [bacterium]